MKLRIDRFSSQDDDTLGLFFIDGAWSCFTLEDEHRETKLYGETRIPEGVYTVELQRAGRLHDKYAARFPDIHRGMLHICDVPGFEGIMIHCGNKDEHTDGCPLVGDTSQQNITEDGWIGASSAAYRRIYPPIAAALEAGEDVTIEVRNIEGVYSVREPTAQA